jgi:hypothetical protein
VNTDVSEEHAAVIHRFGVGRRCGQVIRHRIYFDPEGGGRIFL